MIDRGLGIDERETVETSDSDDDFDCLLALRQMDAEDCWQALALLPDAQIRRIAALMMEADDETDDD